jgi:tetraacyldisaccharide 4'-kinase
MNEAALHELLSGRRKDFAAMLLRSGLSAAECLYWLAIQGRNLAYARRLFSQHRVSVPVISVGNITTGGTGKTPIAAWLANWLVSRGRKPGLISRGYRALDRGASTSDGQSVTANDEKLVLDRLCPGIPHYQQQDRTSAAKLAIAESGCDVLLLDDAFQHRKLQRDLDLVLIDALNPFGYDHLLPRGLLRESLTGLKRADLIIVTRANQCSPNQRHALLRQIGKYCASDEIVEVAFKPTRLVDIHWNPHPLTTIRGKKLLVFCGIGNPEGFRRTISDLGGAFAPLRQFPDHHHYEQPDFQTLQAQAMAEQAEYAVTTQKDLVKIRPADWTDPQLMSVEIGIEFLSGESVLKNRLDQLLQTSDFKIHSV